MIRTSAVLFLGVLLPGLAWPAVKQSAPGGFLIEHKFQIAAAPSVAWQVLVHPERYWPTDHTWSGNSGNLSLVPEAGGCFCERWADGSVEHGRVIHARRDRMLRFNGALGPLQELAVTGVLTVTLVPAGNGTEATVTYRVSGDASHKLDGFVNAVDAVVGQQFGGFAELASRTQH